jgi:hypothetical protein
MEPSSKTRATDPGGYEPPSPPSPLREDWIEWRTERMHQRALGSADTLEQRRIRRMTLGSGDGALQIVGDCEKLAREICNGVLAVAGEITFAMVAEMRLGLNDVERRLQSL